MKECTHSEFADCPACALRVADLEARRAELASDWEADAAAADMVYGR